VFPYIGLPDGSTVLFEEGKTVFFRPNENEGRLDEVEPLSD
jgi:hypothetical protein